MTANELRNQTFDKSAFGFKTDEVSECLMEAARSLEDLELKINELESENKKLKEKIEDYKADEESMKNILVNAQKVSSSVINEARGKAVTLLEEAKRKSSEMLGEATSKSENLITEAEGNSKKIVMEATAKANAMLKEAEQTVNSISADAKEKADREQARLNKMQREVSDFKAQLLNIYKTHLDLITKLPELKEEKPEEAKIETKPGPVSEPSPSHDTFDSVPDYKEKQEKPEQNPVDGSIEKGEMAKTAVIGNKSAYKITITEKKDEKEEKPKKPDYKSRFGELKFGEHSK